MSRRVSARTDMDIARRLMVSPLFKGMSVEDVDKCFMSPTGKVR